VIGSVLILAVLILLSGFFSGAEIALFSLGEARVRSLEEEGRRGAATLARLKSNPERLLATILVFNNIVNIGAASFATALALDLFGSQGVAYATGVMTLLILVFGEITPKGFASANNVEVSLVVAPVIHLLGRLMYPIVAPLEALTRWFVYRSNRIGAPSVTEGEIREMTAIGHAEGSIDERERQIIERAFWLDEKRAWDVMTPRVEIFAWPADRPLAEIADELQHVRYSRIPVFRETVDDIVGVLYVRDAYQALVAGQGTLELGALAREPLIVPGSISLTRLLSEFQTRRIHVGIVIDEYGGTDGLVTLEDIIEELVGEIVDETDVERQPIVRVSRSEIDVEGGADVREINHFFNTAFPLLEHRSLNGYILDELGYVPKPDEELEREGVVIRILEATETQVLRARLVRLAAGDEPAETPSANEATGDGSRPETDARTDASAERR
jgi:putative hemolysin